MKALVYDQKLTLTEIDTPRRRPGDVLIRVTKAGICNTDHEIIRGYSSGFKGVLGHEFIGIVREADDSSLIGKRVTAEINAACGTCEFCKKGLGRHCMHRTVMGIVDRNGALAQWVAVPADTVVPVPDDIPDSSAIFIEPLAAACEILEQLPIGTHHSVLLIGDGKLAAMIGLVLKPTGCRMMVVGKHVRKGYDGDNYKWYCKEITTRESWRIVNGLREESKKAETWARYGIKRVIPFNKGNTE